MRLDGFKLEVTSDEVLAHFTKRLNHHKDALALLESSPVILVGKDGGKDGTEIMKLHRHQIRLLEFLTSHVAAGDTYLLSMNEISQLTLLQEITDYSGAA